MKRRWETCASGSQNAQRFPSSGSQTESSQSYLQRNSNASINYQRQCNELRFIEKGRQQWANLTIDEPLPQTTISREVEEYRAIIRAQYLKHLGRNATEVAHELKRSDDWVRKWWQTPVSEVSRPRDLPQYICKYELRMLQLGVEPFRSPELRRNYVGDTAGLYQECAQWLPWQQAMIRNRNYQTGELAVTNVASNRQDCIIRGMHTGIPRLDEAIRRIRKDLNIEDPHAFLVCNWYPDGRSSIGAHNHDHWSAILSFGSSRVFLLDERPLLLGDGDLLVFGTQRHSLPKMPDISDGRISIGLFWYPEQRDSVILAPSSFCARCGLQDVLLQEAPDGNSYCEICWTECIQVARCSRNETAVAEDEMLAIALQLSLTEQ